VTIAAGTRLGPYEILSPLGAGGMGKVYKARDTRLGREVAVKVLPEEFARDVERLRRFEGESRSASALSDPHIVTVYDVGEANGVHFFASELVEGSDLRRMMDRGPMPARKAMELGEQIASGLAAAHEKGIVHRDLKPENVLLTKSGIAKIADFGLAKLSESSGREGSQLPTTDGRQTAAGVVMGTVRYMSPEQARGAPVDFRSDQFGFGTVLYEMLSGKNPFARSSSAQTMAAIIESEPEPLSELRPEISESVAWVVDRCLAKSPDERYGSTRDLARDLRQLALKGTSASGGAARIAARDVRATRKRTMILAVAAAVLLGGAAGFLASRLLSGRKLRHSAVRLSIPAPVGSTFGTGLALSPDGRFVAFAATRENVPMLWLRPLSAAEARPLPGTEGAINPFWSPDGRFLGFFADNAVRKIEVSTGVIHTICRVANLEPFAGGAWNRDGVILFAPDSHGPLFRVSAAGGSAVPASTLDPALREDCHVWPEFLPDGRHYLFSFYSRNGSGVAIGELDSRERKPLLPDAWRAVYSDAFLLFVRDRSLMAQPFDPGKRALSGEPFSVAERIGYTISADTRGDLVYRAGTTESRQLRWFDRAGRDLGKVGKAGDYFEPALSPDGRRVAIDVGPWTPVGDVWLLDLERGTSSRLTFDPNDDATPVWSPDQRRIAYASNRNGIFDVFVRDLRGSEKDETLWHADGDKFPQAWSPDGTTILCERIDPKTKSDLWILPLDRDRKPEPYLNAEYNEASSVFSPDGRWVAYTSDESGRPEVYVRAFPHPGGKIQISTHGGDKPIWRSDGKEILYLAPDRKIMSVAIRPGAEFSAGLPEALFEAAVHREGITDSRSQFVVSPDGRRILVDSISDEANTPITVALDWTQLRR
jgi:Tol biopolymer transport system component